jgi:peroxiredoxin family protein
MNTDKDLGEPAPVPPLSSMDGKLNEVLKRLQALEGQVLKGGKENRLSMLVFSGSLDRILSAFVLASTAAASGMQVEMFFTFWGLAALRDARKNVHKDLLGKMFGWMLPRGMKQLPLSQMQMGGMGPAMIRHVMKQKRMASLDEMVAICAEFQVRISACDMSREIMGITPEELIDYPYIDCCGAASFIERATSSQIAFFI